MNQYGSFHYLASLTIDAMNVVDGKAIYYFVNKTRLNASNVTNPSYIFLVNCNDSSIVSPVGQGSVHDISLYYSRNNTISSFEMTGLLVLYSSTNNTITTNVIRHPQPLEICGIRVYQSDANIIRNNDILGNNYAGIYSYASDRCIIEQNTVTTDTWFGDGLALEWCTDTIVRDNVMCDNLGAGIRIWNGRNISITGNDISRNCEDGIETYDTDDSFISNNDITSNLEYGIDLWSSEGNEVAWNRIYYNEDGCINQDDYSDANDIHDNDCKQSTTWTMDHVVIPTIQICTILAIFVLTFILIAKYKGRIRKWINAHSRDVSLEQEYIALKDKIKDASFLRGRIAEFYVLVGSGIALSILIYVFAEYLPTYYPIMIVFWWIFVCSGIGFIAVAVIGAWAFKRKALRSLVLLRLFTGVLIIWMLVYFISNAIWPLYVLRYAYDVVGAGLLSVFFPGSQMFVDFPWYGIVWRGETYQFYISVGIVHPIVWGAFIGFGLFIPGQSIHSKIKKGLLFFLIDQLVEIITILIQQILYIEAKLDWSDVHYGDVTFAINIIVGIAWRVIVILIQYPDTRVLARSVLHGALKTDPVHVVFPNHVEDKIKQQLIADGGHELGGNDELKQINQRWGIALKIDTEHELHVRAHGHGLDHFSLSAHFEYGRDTGKHLLVAGDYKEGKRILLEYLTRKGFEMPSE